MLLVHKKKLKKKSKETTKHNKKQLQLKNQPCNIYSNKMISQLHRSNRWRWMKLLLRVNKLLKMIGLNREIYMLQWNNQQTQLNPQFVALEPDPHSETASLNNNQIQSQNNKKTSRRCITQTCNDDDDDLLTNQS